MRNYATTEDMEAMWREMTAEERQRADEMIPVISSMLRMEAAKVGKDLDMMVDQSEDMANVARSVTVDVVARVLMTTTKQEPMSQMSQSALGYSVSGTFLVPGGGVLLKSLSLRGSAFGGSR